MADEYYQQVLGALGCLYSTHATSANDTFQRKQADQFLQTFLQAPISWEISDRILREKNLPTNYYFYAANALVYRLRSHFMDLPGKPQREAFRESLMNNLSAFFFTPHDISTAFHGNTKNQQVVERLATGLSVLTLHMISLNEWDGALDHITSLLLTPELAAGQPFSNVMYDLRAVSQLLVWMQVFATLPDTLKDNRFIITRDADQDLCYSVLAQQKTKIVTILAQVLTVCKPIMWKDNATLQNINISATTGQGHLPSQLLSLTYEQRQVYLKLGKEALKLLLAWSQSNFICIYDVLRILVLPSNVHPEKVWSDYNLSAQHNNGTPQQNVLFAHIISPVPFVPGGATNNVVNTQQIPEPTFQAYPFTFYATLIYNCLIVPEWMQLTAQVLSNLFSNGGARVPYHYTPHDSNSNSRDNNNNNNNDNQVELPSIPSCSERPNKDKPQWLIIFLQSTLVQLKFIYNMVYSLEETVIPNAIAHAITDFAILFRHYFYQDEECIALGQPAHAFSIEQQKLQQTQDIGYIVLQTLVDCIQLAARPCTGDYITNYIQQPLSQYFILTNHTSTVQQQYQLTPQQLKGYTTLYYIEVFEEDLHFQFQSMGWLRRNVLHSFYNLFDSVGYEYQRLFNTLRQNIEDIGRECDSRHRYSQDQQTRKMEEELNFKRFQLDVLTSRNNITFFPLWLQLLQTAISATQYPAEIDRSIITDGDFAELHQHRHFTQMLFGSIIPNLDTQNQLSIWNEVYQIFMQCYVHQYQQIYNLQTKLQNQYENNNNTIYHLTKKSMMLFGGKSQQQDVTANPNDPTLLLEQQQYQIVQKCLSETTDHSPDSVASQATIDYLLTNQTLPTTTNYQANDLFGIVRSVTPRPIVYSVDNIDQTYNPNGWQPLECLLWALATFLSTFINQLLYNEYFSYVVDKDDNSNDRRGERCVSGRVYDSIRFISCGDTPTAKQGNDDADQKEFLYSQEQDIVLPTLSSIGNIIKIIITELYVHLHTFTLYTTFQFIQNIACYLTLQTVSIYKADAFLQFDKNGTSDLNKKQTNIQTLLTNDKWFTILSGLNNNPNAGNYNQQQQVDIPPSLINNTNNILGNNNMLLRMIIQYILQYAVHPLSWLNNTPKGYALTQQEEQQIKRGEILALLSISPAKIRTKNSQSSSDYSTTQHLNADPIGDPTAYAFALSHCAGTTLRNITHDCRYQIATHYGSELFIYFTALQRCLVFTGSKLTPTIFLTRLSQLTTHNDNGNILTKLQSFPTPDVLYQYLIPRGDQITSVWVPGTASDIMASLISVLPQSEQYITTLTQYCQNIFSNVYYLFQTYTRFWLHHVQEGLKTFCQQVGIAANTTSLTLQQQQGINKYYKIILKVVEDITSYNEWLITNTFVSIKALFNGCRRPIGFARGKTGTASLPDTDINSDSQRCQLLLVDVVHTSMPAFKSIIELFSTKSYKFQNLSTAFNNNNSATAAIIDDDDEDDDNTHKNKNKKNNNNVIKEHIVVEKAVAIWVLVLERAMRHSSRILPAICEISCQYFRMTQHSTFLYLADIAIRVASDLRKSQIRLQQQNQQQQNIEYFDAEQIAQQFHNYYIPVVLQVANDSIKQHHPQHLDFNFMQHSYLSMLSTATTDNTTTNQQQGGETTTLSLQGNALYDNLIVKQQMQQLDNILGTYHQQYYPHEHAQVSELPRLPPENYVLSEQIINPQKSAPIHIAPHELLKNQHWFEILTVTQCFIEQQPEIAEDFLGVLTAILFYQPKVLFTSPYFINIISLIISALHSTNIEVYNIALLLIKQLYSLFLYDTNNARQLPHSINAAQQYSTRQWYPSHLIGDTSEIQQYLAQQQYILPLNKNPLIVQRHCPSPTVYQPQNVRYLNYLDFYMLNKGLSNIHYIPDDINNNVNNGQQTAAPSFGMIGSVVNLNQITTQDVYQKYPQLQPQIDNNNNNYTIVDSEGLPLNINKFTFQQSLSVYLLLLKLTPTIFIHLWLSMFTSRQTNNTMYNSPIRNVLQLVLQFIFEELEFINIEKYDITLPCTNDTAAHTSISGQRNKHLIQQFITLFYQELPQVILKQQSQQQNQQQKIHQQPLNIFNSGGLLQLPSIPLNTNQIQQQQNNNNNVLQYFSIEFQQIYSLLFLTNDNKENVPTLPVVFKLMLLTLTFYSAPHFTQQTTYYQSYLTALSESNQNQGNNTIQQQNNNNNNTNKLYQEYLYCNHYIQPKPYTITSTATLIDTAYFALKTQLSLLYRPHRRDLDALDDDIHTIVIAVKNEITKYNDDDNNNDGGDGNKE